MTNARHLSLSSEHFTPADVVEAARATMGGIDLDPAWCALASNVVKATRFFGIADNGFLQGWGGAKCGQTSRVFLNPPGGKCAKDGIPMVSVDDPVRPGKKKLIRVDNGQEDTSQSSQKAWWFKLAKEWLEGRVEQAVFVGFSLEILQVTQSDTPRIFKAGSAPVPLPIPLDFPCCYPRKRIAYLKAVESCLVPGALEDEIDLVVGGSPPHASVLVWLPPRKVDERGNPLVRIRPALRARFLKAFEPLGKCVIPETA